MRDAPFNKRDQQMNMGTAYVLCMAIFVVGGCYLVVTEHYAWAWIPTPKSYNASTFTVRFIWTHPTAATNFGVVWQAEMLSLSIE